jgi:hypothetical protein
MSIWESAGLLLLGIAIGTFSGTVGLGGGILVIPTLMLFLGFSQRQANGTSLAMLLPPIGIFAVMAYHKAGDVNWPVACLLAAGFMPGAYLGAWIVQSGMVSERGLRLVFGYFLLYVAGRFLFRTGAPARAGVETALLMAAYGIARLFARSLGRKLAKQPYWPQIYQDRLARPEAYDYEI